MLQDGWILLT